MAELTMARLIAADPAGTALLLAGPGALELCPVSLDLRATPPVRTATAFETRFECLVDGRPAGRGRVVVRGERPGLTRATLDLSYDPALLTAPHEVAETFLRNLATAAEDRSSAA